LGYKLSSERFTRPWGGERGGPARILKPGTGLTLGLDKASKGGLDGVTHGGRNGTISKNEICRREENAPPPPQDTWEAVEIK